MRDKKLRSLDDGELHLVRLEKTPGGYRVAGSEPSASIVRSPSSRIWSILTESGASFEALVERRDGEIHVTLGHRSFRFSAANPRTASRTGGAPSSRVAVKAPMPGKVVQVLVSAGESVRAGQPMLLFEAMKMQNELRSPQDGVVVEVAVAAGRAVEARELLYVLDPPPV